jgi:hypothetical protein
MKTLWPQYTPTDDTFQSFFLACHGKEYHFSFCDNNHSIERCMCAINAQLAPGLGIIMVFFFSQQ